MSELPLPPFFHSDNASSWPYQPEPIGLLSMAAQYRNEHRVVPASRDSGHVQLLLVDVQRDFCLPKGALFVAGRSGRGAVDDSARIAAFIYRNLATLSEITVTLDSHLPQQIFFPSFWRDSSGKHLQPHREISAEQVRNGEVCPVADMAGWASEVDANADSDWLAAHALWYCEQLERQGKYRLYLWPPHCLLGSDGHALVGVVQEARLFHSYVRLASSPVRLKGTSMLTENYSALAPEVLTGHDGTPLAQRDEELTSSLLGSQVLIIAGQAASHCVKSTVDDLLLEAEKRSSGSSAPKIYVLEDCMSSVVVRDPEDPDRMLADFSDQFEQAKGRWRAQGAEIVRSTTQMHDWPGFGR